MANPFDDTVDEGYNPFAGGYSEPVQPSMQQASPYQDTGYGAYDSYSAPAPAQESSVSNITGFGNAVTSTIASATGAKLVDPVTGMPVTEEQIAIKERQLAEKERQIAAKEQAIANGDIKSVQSRKNFPPFLKWWEYHPDEDLPENARKHAKIIFWIFVAVGIPYAVNLIGAFACLGAQGAAQTSVGLLIGLALCYLFVFYPLSFEVCYFTYYKALITGKGLSFFCSLVAYGIWFALLVMNIIGLEDGGAVGFVIMVNLFNSDPAQTGIGIIAVVFVITGIIVAIAMGWEFIVLIKWYKTEGLAQKAFAEAGQYAAEKAYENRETIGNVLAENPDLVKGAVKNGYAQYA